MSQYHNYPNLYLLKLVCVSVSIVDAPIYKTFVSAKEPQEHHQLQIESSARNVYPGHVMLDACFIFAGLNLLIDNLEANQQSHICGPLSCSFLISASR